MEPDTPRSSQVGDQQPRTGLNSAAPPRHPHPECRRTRGSDRTDVCVSPAPHHLNPNGTAHGGFLMTVLDITLGATVESFLGVDPGRHPVTLQLSCSMLAPARGGELLFAEATVDQSTRTVTFVSARLHSEGRAVVTASAVFRNPRSR